MNCSSESTVQNNSYKLSSSQLVKQNAVIYDLQHRDPTHFRKKSEVNYNFFLNKQGSGFDPKSCKSNNISFQNNESLNSSIRKGDPQKKMGKLEKYFKNSGLNGGQTNPISGKTFIPLKAISKNSLFQSNLYEQFSKNIGSSPKGIKERVSHKQGSSFGNSKFTGPKSKTNSISKSQVNFEKIDLSPIFVSEELLFKFMIYVHQEADLYNIFKQYIEYVQEQDFEALINLIDLQVLGETFKNAFILERMALMMSFYLSINGLYKKEIVFLKKIAVLVYSNLFLFLKIILKALTNSQLNVF